MKMIQLLFYWITHRSSIEKLCDVASRSFCVGKQGWIRCFSINSWFSSLSWGISDRWDLNFFSKRKKRLSLKERKWFIFFNQWITYLNYWLIVLFRIQQIQVNFYEDHENVYNVFQLSIDNLNYDVIEFDILFK